MNDEALNAIGSYLEKPLSSEVTAAPHGTSVTLTLEGERLDGQQTLRGLL